MFDGTDGSRTLRRRDPASLGTDSLVLNRALSSGYKFVRALWPFPGALLFFASGPLVRPKILSEAVPRKSHLPFRELIEYPLRIRIAIGAAEKISVAIRVDRRGPFDEVGDAPGSLTFQRGKESRLPKKSWYT